MIATGPSPTFGDDTMATAFILLLLGFAFNAASAFTGSYARWFGDRPGQILTGILRNVVGIPVWVSGLVLAVGLPSQQIARVSVLSAAVAWVLLGAGALLQLMALLALRRSAALPSMRDGLVQHGIYAHIRHPIYAGLLLEFAGIVLLHPHFAAILACALGACWCILQAHLEEVDLVQRIPAYREYMARLPRFAPRISHTPLSRRRPHRG